MTDHIQSIRYALHEHGYRLTPAREAILRALVDSGGHVTADALVELVHEQSPRIGRMTVYRTLDVLCDLGVLRPVYQGTGAAHFVLMEDGHHHHLICSGCEQVVEFDDCVVEALQEAIGRRFDFQVQGHLLELYGLCPDCQVDLADSA